MRWESADKIADALLYEGYLLYPYRGSAVKNRYRWQFGIVAPREYGAAGGSEPWLMQTECLLRPGTGTRLHLKLRFLHVEGRQVEAPAEAAGGWEPVESLRVDGREMVSWDEAVPGEFVLSDLAVTASATTENRLLEVSGGREVEVVHDAGGTAVARIIRERWPISCRLQLTLEPLGDYRKLRVRLENVTPWPLADASDRPSALRRSLVATHTLLAVTEGAFVSLLEPPADAAAGVAGCENLHTWPVLVGAVPRRDLMLSSPIILYDYPAVAPESPGDLFDGTEIDELLTLRLLTLTDEERRQALATDPRAGRLIERATSLPTEQLERLHGAIRYFGEPMQPTATPSSLEAWLNPPGSEAEEAVDAGGRRVRAGTRVRLLPTGQADAMDMFLREQTATVAAVYRDLEDRAHVAVTVDAGGAADLHESNGRYFYFRPEEVEVLDPGGEVEPRPDPARATRVLVAGIGNVFLGDDGFGSAVAQRLALRSLPEWVRVEDFGIRSVHLAYDLLDAAYETTILIDAVPRGGVPGTLYVVEPQLDDTPMQSHDAHSLSVEGVLELLRNLGGNPGRVLIVGCEPLSIAPEMGLSDVVSRAVDGAADLVMDLIARVEG